MAKGAAQYDITHLLGQHLDRHLVFPLLDFLQAKEVYSEEELLDGKLDLLSKTNMVDFAMEIWSKRHDNPTPPEEMVKRREEVIQNLLSIQDQCGNILALITPESEDQECIADTLIREKLFDMAYLSEEYGVTQEHLKGFYEFARFQFGCGNYTAAADLLAYYRVLSSSQEKCFSALWGKLAAEILMPQWDIALGDLKQLQQLIENRTSVSAAVQLKQRTWLMHWSLFVFFNHPNGRNSVVELFMSDKYLNAIQTTCPHLLRYLVVAAVTNKRKRNTVKDVVRVIQMEEHSYSDPLTQFLECLYVSYDFAGAWAKLAECQVLLSTDYFLSKSGDDFIENARLLVFETYCRVHECIEIEMLAKRLNMTEEQAERWIVTLVRNAHLDAKIDSAKDQVVLGSQSSNVYQQLIDRTKGICKRTYDMNGALQKLN
eukprot:CAMPEP_0119148204 /NCGR_PEP_ID=MMETSP1310-20130426/41488_1 /TAXON_ID=464262 /ORGANISM="Genus nov. species nov., Strain RCC2339" /LENGTH=429 /DNA_ID=CAMNT_0007140229 /DNA_START=74 /DNA_END=1363 /DNA_ORIENTATION=-